MSKPLILMACSGTKLAHPAPAQDLYQGVMWQSLRANASEGNLPHIVVLSALHGFVSGDTVIEPYEKLLTPVRSREFEYDLGQFVKSVAWPRNAKRILLAGGGLYRYLMRRMVGELIRAGKLGNDLQISEVTGGIGLQRSQIGKFVRDPSSVPVAHVGYHPNGTPLFREAWGLTVGDRVKTAYAGGKAAPRFARVEELFIGPGGPTACVEFEDDRPPLASGKERAPMQCRGAWVGVSMLVRIAPRAEQVDSTIVDLDDVWSPISGLQALAGNEAPEMEASFGSGIEECEAASPGMQ